MGDSGGKIVGIKWVYPGMGRLGKMRKSEARIMRGIVKRIG